MKKIILILLASIFHQYLFSQENFKKRYNLMPWPQNISENNSSFKINESLTISISGEDSENRVKNASVQFLRRLSNRTGVFINNGFPVKDNIAPIQLRFESVSNLKVNSNETYAIEVKENNILIKATTDVGVLRGLETLLQLVNFNKEGYYFEGVVIKDAPRFLWRGLMIDVSRHFQPISVLKRNLDAMASVKLNVFHWHLTDDQGFRVASKTYPKLQKFASDGLFYTHEQIKEVVAYASNLGIRVIPEFDVPGHATAILTAYPELGSKKNYDYKVERFSGVFDPTLNPILEDTYTFLENLFTEIAPLFPDEYFHIGGDENEGKHWDENKEIQAFKKENGLKTNHELQTYFNIKLEKILKKLGKKLMGWDEILTPSTPTTAVIHSWRGKQEGLAQSTLIEAAKKGYQTVLSNGFYIDRMLSVKHHYLKDPIGNEKLTKEERSRILGAETTMWSELVTPTTIDSRIWPRTAAIAERFWSSKEIRDLDDMLRRLKVVNTNLEELGINHIRNTDYILRNIAKDNDIEALKVLSKICEPLKIYSRNKGGTEYKTFSPFTLFADACVVDAEDAIIFNENVTDYLLNEDNINLKEIIYYLEIWSENHEKFTKINKNPISNSLAPLSNNLSKISTILLRSINKKNISKTDLNKAKELNNKLQNPIEDVELVVTESFDKLIKLCEKKFL